jgi:hypothetical protein
LGPVLRKIKKKTQNQPTDEALPQFNAKRCPIQNTDMRYFGSGLQPCTFNPAPSRLHLQPCTVNPAPSTLRLQPCTINPAPLKLNPKTYPDRLESRPIVYRSVFQVT